MNRKNTGIAVMTFTVGAWITGIALTAPAQDASAEKTPTVDEIVQNTNRVAYYQGEDGRADVSMNIIDDQGRTRRRQFTILRRDEQPEGDKDDEFTEEQKFYVYFTRPADVNKTAYLVWKHMDKDDDRWLYLPALDLVKRVAASDKRTSFVGSHFYYEDISGRNINADIHELEEVTDNYYVLKNTPKEPDTVEFSYYRMYIHKQTFIPVKTEYFDKKELKYRQYEALKVDTIDGYPTVTRARMSDLRTEGKTEIAYRKVEYNIGLPENIFTERYLRNPPRQFID